MATLGHKPDVVLVSVFGRGNWLAAELKNEGFSVTLIDLSGSMGRWAPEDWEGPFGLFRSESLRPSQFSRLIEEDYQDAMDRGFAVWLKQGPLELTGPLTGFMLDRLDVSDELRHYLMDFDSANESAKSQWRQMFQDRPFQSTWLAQLAHNLASPVFISSAQSVTRGRPLPLFSPLFVRRVTRRGREKSLDWLESIGVTVHRDAEAVDLNIQGRLMQGVEIQGKHSGFVGGENFVWMLTGEETAHCHSNLTAQLFPKGFVSPKWGWMRFRLRVQEGPYLDSMPGYFVLINDLCLPWSHANLSVVQKSVSARDFDCWVRVPTNHRFQKEYLSNIGDELVRQFSERLPGSSPEVSEMPQDYKYDSSELGPPRFPVYEPEDIKNISRTVASNLYFDGPELWELLDWTGQFSHQDKVLSQIIDWRVRKEKASAKSAQETSKEASL